MISIRYTVVLELPDNTPITNDAVMDAAKAAERAAAHTLSAALGIPLGDIHPPTLHASLSNAALERFAAREAQS